MNNSRELLDDPVRAEWVREWSPLIIWQGLDMDDVPKAVSLVVIEVDDEFNITQALVRLNSRNLPEKGISTPDDLHLFVGRPNFGRHDFYIGERPILASWFKSACIAIQDCISPRAIQKCLMTAVNVTPRTPDGLNVKPDWVSAPIHREFCRQLSIARYSG